MFMNARNAHKEEITNGLYVSPWFKHTKDNFSCLVFALLPSIASQELQLGLIHVTV